MWQPIETAPRDGTIFTVCWPHNEVPSGWMFDIWCGHYLQDAMDRVSQGYGDASPHLFWVPTHWQPLPEPPQ